MRKFRIWIKCDPKNETEYKTVARQSFAEAASSAYGLVHEMLGKTGTNWRVDQIKDIGKVEDEQRHNN